MGKKKKNEKPDEPIILTAEQYEAIGRKSITQMLEYGWVPPAVSAAATVIKDGKAYIQEIRKSEIAIIDTGHKGKSYFVEIEVRNKGRHSCYVESIQLVRPAKRERLRGEITLNIDEIHGSIRRDDAAIALEKEPLRLSPRHLLRPDQWAQFKIWFSSLNPTDITTFGYGELKVTISRLEENEPSEEMVKFMIRSP